MIDLSTEPVEPFSALARKVPSRTGKNGVHVATVWRWAKNGVHGVKLDSVMVGGTWMSSVPALHRFFAATTAASGDSSPSIRTSSQRERAITAAEQELHS